MLPAQYVAVIHWQCFLVLFSCSVVLLVFSCSAISLFPSDLKLANATPVYKKNSKNSKDKYRPVSTLSNISKIYGRCISDEIQLFFDSLLSKYQFGFRKGYNTKNCLISVIEKRKKSDDNGSVFGALLTDLTKTCSFQLLSQMEIVLTKFL